MASDLVLVTGREPWERQPAESATAFEAFALYRDMGATRSLDRVAQQTGTKHDSIRLWAKHNRWEMRAAAWDVELDRVRYHAQLDAIVAMSRRHAKMAALAQERIVRRLQSMDPREMTINQLVELWDLSTRIEREALGLGKGGAPQMPLPPGATINAQQNNITINSDWLAMARENGITPEEVLREAQHMVARLGARPVIDAGPAEPAPDRGDEGDSETEAGGEDGSGGDLEGECVP